MGDNPFGQASYVVALGFMLGVIVRSVAGIKKKDPYDLRDLIRLQQKEELRAIDDELAQIDSAGNNICIHCDTHFDPSLNRCPRCGRSIFC